MPDEVPEQTLDEFLPNTPPMSLVLVLDGINEYASSRDLKIPSIRLYCDSEHCGGIRTHDCGTESFEVKLSGGRIFIDYSCRHCRRTNKTYALLGRYHKTAGCLVLKVGETPHFGPHTPAKVLRMLGDDKDLYLKGRRAESHGLGIAAFAYYRRVVENHKNDLITEIIRVADHVGAPPGVISSLEKAKGEISFEKSVEMVKGGMPPSLLLRGGHNPLSLLHTALSAGLHNDDDADCLALAGDIRAVLADFAERVQSAMKESQELNAAVSRLLQKQQKP